MHLILCAQILFFQNDDGYKFLTIAMLFSQKIPCRFSLAQPPYSLQLHWIDCLKVRTFLVIWGESTPSSFLPYEEWTNAHPPHLLK